jgi:hypothetical protein
MGSKIPEDRMLLDEMPLQKDKLSQNSRLVITQAQISMT